MDWRAHAPGCMSISNGYAPVMHSTANKRRLAARPGGASGGTRTGAASGRVQPAGKQPAGSNLPHRLARALPKRLCAEGAASGAAPAVPGALLLFWAPAAPSESGGPAAGAARAAAAAYGAKFGELAGAAAWGEAGSTGLAMCSWAAFVGRWLAATRAALRGEQACALPTPIYWKGDALDH